MSWNMSWIALLELASHFVYALFCVPYFWFKNHIDCSIPGDVCLNTRSMTGESGFADDPGAYGADPLMCLGEDLREGTLGRCKCELSHSLLNARSTDP